MERTLSSTFRISSARLASAIGFIVEKRETSARDMDADTVVSLRAASILPRISLHGAKSVGSPSEGIISISFRSFTGSTD